MRSISFLEKRKIQLEILLYVHNLCVENGIRYSLAFGTLLGTVRHKGFIPWDDDIDVALPRKDYDKLESLLQSSDSIYKIASYKNDIEVHCLFNKVYDSRTLVDEGCNTKNIGVCIDLFPLDALEDTEEASRKYLNSFSQLRFEHTVKIRRLSTVRKKWKKVALLILKAILVFVDYNSIPYKMESRIRKHKTEAKFCTTIMDCDTSIIVPSKVWEEYDMAIFEGHKFYIVKDFDTMLRCLYGDYLELPPEEQRVPKHDIYSCVEL